MSFMLPQFPHKIIFPGLHNYSGDIQIILYGLKWYTKQYRLSYDHIAQLLKMSAM